MIIIGEKINGSIPAVGEAIFNRDATVIRNLALEQERAGADYIDVCASVGSAIELETMAWLIDQVQHVTDIPVAVDSPDAALCAKALKFCKRPGMVNSVSMEGDKVDQIFSVIADTPWACVALLCDDRGIPSSVEQRLEIFSAIMKKAKAYGISPSRLYIDPLVEMLCASAKGIRVLLDVISRIKEAYPDIHVTGGASNISFNLPARKFVNHAFLVLAMGAGMDSAIINPQDRYLTGLIYAAEALMGRDDYCIKYINAFREGAFLPCGLR